MIELLKEIILDFQDTVLNTGIPRHFQYKPVQGKAFVCIGVRRCGKSTLLYQIIKKIEAQGIKLENILYINFFDDRLTGLKQGNLSLIIDAYYSLYPEKKGTEEIYCFFDEIQEAKNWEQFIDRILRTEKCSVYLSGSSAKLLSREIATQMRGRSLSWELFPFSFSEFISYKGINFKQLTSRNRLLLQNCFDEYFLKGGFPEVRDASAKIRVMIHQEYFKTILHRDVIERFNVIHPQATIQAGYRLISSSASLYSINRITDYLKSLGYKVSKGFVSSCVEWFEDVYFLFSVKIFSPSILKQNANAKKIYCIDHSMVTSIAPKILENKGHLLENMMFTHLRRHTEQIYYYRTKKGKEIDFIWMDNRGNRHLMQISFSLKDPATRKREISSLSFAMEELRLQEATIITYNEEDLIKVETGVIKIIPAWKYML
ncbi:MAG: ATP-binding protein [Candidatus Desulfaltia sp.]|nr:ATP-binding protein [Candidatus Desulfaltia sp.]